MEKKHNGAFNELTATCWLLERGYEVFRNVSPHGNVDIIAMKDGETTLFDVKKASLGASGEPIDLKLRAEQIAMGVKLLIVFGANNECRIIDKPTTPYSRMLKCVECGAEFAARKHKHVACSSDCRRILDARSLYLSRNGPESAERYDQVRRLGRPMAVNRSV